MQLEQERQLKVNLKKVYGVTQALKQEARLKELHTFFCRGFSHDKLYLREQSVQPYHVFSAPGRIEICGNHTDHNQGMVMAAAIHLDMMAIVSKRQDSIVRLKSMDGCFNFQIKLKDFMFTRDLLGTSQGLILGVASSFVNKGKHVGGFDMAMDSNIPMGLGISSSAAFEVLIAKVFDSLYNQDKLSPEFYAQSGKYAENSYFGKDSGLMDQMAVAQGGMSFMDFKEESPFLEKLPFDFQDIGLLLCLVKTGDSHQGDLHLYDSIPLEMKSIASFFGVKTLRFVTEEMVLKDMEALRDCFGDRAVLRSLHYFKENQRVEALRKAMKEKDEVEIRKLICESGYSSFQYLQNVYSPEVPQRQSISLALFLAEKLLKGKGAWRIHGGGFGGTTINFFPKEMKEEFQTTMEGTFGVGCCHFVEIRRFGTLKLTDNKL